MLSQFTGRTLHYPFSREGPCNIVLYIVETLRELVMCVCSQFYMSGTKLIGELTLILGRRDNQVGSVLQLMCSVFHVLCQPSPTKLHDECSFALPHPMILVPSHLSNL